MAGVSNMSIVWDFLQEHGKITHSGIIDLTGTNCPYDIIRKIRQRYGENSISWEDHQTSKKLYVGGKEIVRKSYYREYFLNKMAGGINEK